MHKFLALLCSLLVLALAGCASPAGSVKSGFDDNADYVKMTAVNREALLRGHRIVWIHAPEKEKPKSVPTDG